MLVVDSDTGRPALATGRTWARSLLAIVAVLVLVGVLAQPARAEFRIETFEAHALNSAGEDETQAGAHPYSATTSFSFNTVLKDTIFGPGTIEYPEEHIKNVVVDLPAGFVGDPTSIPVCSRFDFTIDGLGRCPIDSQVGILVLRLSNGIIGPPQYYTAGVYNVAPAVGDAAAFAALVNSVPVQIRLTVASDNSNRVRATISDISTALPVTSTRLTLWGVPGDASHDAQRGLGFRCDGSDGTDPSLCSPGGGYSSSSVAKPLLTNPTLCGPPVTTNLSLDTWEHPGSWISATATTDSGGTGCDSLSFDPSVDIVPDWKQADAPTGLTVHLAAADRRSRERRDAQPAQGDGHVAGRHEPRPRLSRWVDGLQRRADRNRHEESGRLPGCVEGRQREDRDTAVVGGADGRYLRRAAHDRKPYRIFLAARASSAACRSDSRASWNWTRQDRPDHRVVRRQPAVAVQRSLPDVHGGSHVTLATPQQCRRDDERGVHAVGRAGRAGRDTDHDLRRRCRWPWRPYSRPRVPRPPSRRARRCHELVLMLRSRLTFSREDRTCTPRPHRVDAAGARRSLANVPLCGESAARSGSCPAASRVGSVTTAAGPGPTPLVLGGQVYLTDAYGGGPFGLSIVVPARRRTVRSRSGGGASRDLRRPRDARPCASCRIRFLRSSKESPPASAR